MDETDAQASRVWPELEQIAQPARERRRLPPEQRSDIIVRLCSVLPLSVKELGTLLDRSEAYIGDAIRPLVTSGQLTFLYPDQPRHPKQKYIGKASTPEPQPQPQPTPTPTPTPAPRIPMAVPAPSPIPRPPLSPPSPAYNASTPMPRRHRRPAPFPNAAVNIIVVAAVGVILGRSAVSGWFIIAAVAAVALAATHILANSVQYDRFRALHGSRSPGIFVLAKAGVALVEIVVVFSVAHYFFGR